MVIFYVVFGVGYLVFVSLVWIALVVDLGLCWLCFFLLMVLVMVVWRSIVFVTGL